MSLTAVLAITGSTVSLLGVFIKLLYDYFRLRTASKESIKTCNESKEEIRILQAKITKLESDLAIKTIELNSLKNELEDHKDNAKTKFTELYNSRNETTALLSEMKATLSAMNENLDKRLQDIKAFFERGK